MNFNKILRVALACILMFSCLSFLTIEANAQEVLKPINKNAEITLDLTEDNVTPQGKASTKGIRLPNAVTTRLIPSDTGLTIKVNNIGVDTIDSITVKIKAPGIYTKKNKGNITKTKTVTFTNVFPGITKTKTMNIPMVRSKMTYKGTVTSKDSGKKVTSTASASREFSTDQLSQVWLKGNSKTLRDAVDYHFGKHYDDKYIRVTNLSQYLKKATNDWKSMKNIKKSNSKYNVRINTDKNEIKVKNNNTKRYIIINKSNKKLYSYGGN